MAFRFTVRDDAGRRSALWSIFTIGGSNVALATTEAGGSVKISLHESGRWQIGYTSEYERRERAAGRWRHDSRHWERWTRPRDVQPGYTSAIKIIVPPVALAPRPEPKRSKPTRFVAARADKGVMFTVCIAKSTIPPWPYGTDQENTVLGTLDLPNGEHVLVGGHYVEGPRATSDMFKSLGRFAQSLLRSDTTELEPLPMDATLLGFSHDVDGTRVIMEIALWSLYALQGTDADAERGEEPDFVGLSDDIESGLIDVPFKIPPSIFTEHGVDLQMEPDRASKIIHEWKSAKIAEMRRLFRLA